MTITTTVTTKKILNNIIQESVEKWTNRENLPKLEVSESGRIIIHFKYCDIESFDVAAISEVLKKALEIEKYSEFRIIPGENEEPAVGFATNETGASSYTMAAGGFYESEYRDYSYCLKLRIRQAFSRLYPRIEVCDIADENGNFINYLDDEFVDFYKEGMRTIQSEFAELVEKL